MPRKKSEPAEGESPRAPQAAEAEAMPPAGAESEPGDPRTPEPSADPEPVTVDAASGDAPAGEPAGPEAAEAVEAAEAASAVAEPEAPEPASEPAEAVPPVAPERVRPAAEPELHEEHEDEGWSFAARALTLLLVLIAGATLGIWAAPKLAPLLPSGLAPVAEWLTPGRSESEAEIAALQARVDQGLGAVEARIADLSRPDDVDARIKAAVDGARAQAAADVAALKQTVDQLAASDAAQQVAQLASSLDGQKAELATLKDQISGAAATTGQLSEDAVKKIDVYRAELDGMRAQVESLEQKVAGFASRLDEVAASADRQIETARTRVSEIQSQASTALTAAETQAAVAQIQAAVEGGQPFAAAVDQLRDRSGVAVPDGLAAAAASGVPTMAALRASFPAAAHDAIRATIVANAGDGILARTRAFFEAQVASRSLTPQAGTGPDAILSRMEDQLRQGNLTGALDEATRLPPEAAAAMSAWLDGARARNTAVQGMATLDASLPATN